MKVTRLLSIIYTFLKKSHHIYFKECSKKTIISRVFGRVPFTQSELFHLPPKSIVKTDSTANSPVRFRIIFKIVGSVRGGATFK